MSEQEKNQPESYETVRPFLKAALEQTLAAGRGVRDMAEFTLERLGDTALPYVNRFLTEVRAGQVRIKGLTASVQQSLFADRPSPEERERMIREAAYLRAQQRGFIGGSPEEDWAEAEREIDARLAAQEGLIARGRHAIDSVAAAAGHGAEATYALVREWLAGHEGRTEEALPQLAHVPESGPAPLSGTTAAKLPTPGDPAAGGEHPVPEAQPARTKTPRTASRAKKEGEPAAPVKATGTRSRKPRSPQTPPTT